MTDSAPAPPDFAPVPRKSNRIDGWNDECQRAFIAALCVAGSPRRAAAAVGKAQWGAEQLRKHPDGASFAAAWDAALAQAREAGTHRLAAATQIAPPPWLAPPERKWWRNTQAPSPGPAALPRARRHVPRRRRGRAHHARPARAARPQIRAEG